MVRCTGVIDAPVVVHLCLKLVMVVVQNPVSRRGWNKPLIWTNRNDSVAVAVTIKVTHTILQGPLIIISKIVTQESMIKKYIKHFQSIHI